MKTTLTILLILVACNLFAQDSLELHRIDSMVSAINTSGLQSRQDSLVQNHPEIGLKMTTYLNMIVKGSELLKYENLVHSNMTENAATRLMITSSTFYYHHNELIKVEEYKIEQGKKKTADWYYRQGKPLYYTLQSEQAADRATFLLTLSKAMVEKLTG